MKLQDLSLADLVALKQELKEQLSLYPNCGSVTQGLEDKIYLVQSAISYHISSINFS